VDYRELMESVLGQATAAGASGAEVLLVENESFSVQVRMREVDTLKNAREKRLGLRLFLGQHSATTATSDVSPASLARLVSDTKAMAEATPEDPFGGMPESGSLASDLPDLDLWDGAAAQLSVPERIALARSAEVAALESDPRITNSEGADYRQGEGQIRFANTSGFYGEYRTSRTSLSMTPVAKDQSGMQRDGWYSVDRKLSRLEPADALGREAARRTLRRLGARKVATQSVPVVFDPDTAADLLGSVCGAVSGSAIYRGASFLAGRLGDQIAAPQCTVVDDGRLPAGLGSRPFDGEGLPTRRTVVIHDGVLQSYLLDTYSARKLALASTGNASRALGQRPTVGPTNFCMLPGLASPAEIIRSVRRGLYVTEMIGFGVNLVTGDYSRGAVGLWIEDGELTHAVEEVTIAGNLRDMLQEIELIGNDLQWRASIACPTLKIARMMVAGN
jgi:PmbA protein